MLGVSQVCNLILRSGTLRPRSICPACLDESDAPANLCVDHQQLGYLDTQPRAQRTPGRSTALQAVRTCGLGGASSCRGRFNHSEAGPVPRPGPWAMSRAERSGGLDPTAIRLPWSPALSASSRPARSGKHTHNRARWWRHHHASTPRRHHRWFVRLPTGVHLPRARPPDRSANRAVVLRCLALPRQARTYVLRPSGNRALADRRHHEKLAGGARRGAAGQARARAFSRFCDLRRVVR